MSALAEELTAVGARLVAVGFSPAPALAALADQLGWAHQFLSDPERRLYARLGLGRALRSEVYNPATLRIYGEARGRGEPIRRPGSPDDRPDPAAMLAALGAAAGAG